jgi:hypothetical protein
MHSRNTARTIGATALAFLIFGAAAPAAAQVITADPAGLQFQCTFVNSPNDCGFSEQARALPRASVVTGISRDGTTSLRLHTEPGDNNVAGSGTAERNDLSLSQAVTGCYAGQEQWWAHSMFFPDDYVAPPAPTAGNWTWGVVFDFHNTTNGGGQANFQINAMPNGLSFQGYAGDPANPVSYTAAIGPTVKNVWYDFVYHVKWSAGSDGYFYASVNGVQKLAYTGPTLYVNQGCYLKLANYHTPFGQASSVIHDRVLRGSTAASVSPPAPPAPPVVPRRVASDFNGDGKSDILWRSALTGQNLIWFMSATTLSSAASIAMVTDLNWKIAATGDFNGDSKADILWRNDATGQNSIWFMNGGTLTSASSPVTVADLNWKIAGAADFDGDGKSDILWHNNATGQNQVWFMNGSTLTAAATLVSLADLNWKIAGVGDFNGDGKSDILWHNDATGQNQLWFMNGGTLTSTAPLATEPDLNSKIVGVGDFDGDGKSDILWRSSTTGRNQIWFMNGATLVSGVAVTTVSDLNWKVAAIGDFDGDGKSDILWRNSATGQDAMFLMSGANVASLTFLAR